LGAAEGLKHFFEDLNEKLRLPEENRFEVFYSPDIDKGRLWLQAVQHKLSTANAAAIVITPENAKSPWMHFEAGAVVSQILGRSETASQSSLTFSEWNQVTWSVRLPAINQRLRPMQTRVAWSSSYSSWLM